MQGNNGNHRGKAHLKTWPDQRLRPEQQHYKAGNRNHPHRQRIAPDRQCQQHQDSADA